MVNIYTTETSISQFVVYIKCSANIRLTLSIPNTTLTASILNSLHIVRRSARKLTCWEINLKECCLKTKHLLCETESFASYCFCQSGTRYRSQSKAIHLLLEAGVHRKKQK
uniref:Uncharacterized protein n=1 Tax=Glossina palpalis gambiensis TaxID=67801 RepID=A0A1B0B5Q6_9MUSC